MKYVAVIAGVCTLAIDVLFRLVLGIPVLLDPLLWNCVGWVEWVLLAPMVVRVAAAVPYRRHARTRFVLTHLAAAVAFALVQLTVYILLRTLIRGTPGTPGRPLADVVIAWLPQHLLLGLLVYGGTVVAIRMTIVLEASRRREEERLALGRWLAQAELDLYKLQLPVDTVNERLREIEETLAHDAERAELLIEEFGAFLRQSLDAVQLHANVDEIAHDEEEMAEDLPTLSKPRLLLLLFSIIPAGHLVVNALFAVSAALRNQPTMPSPVLRFVTGSVVFFPVTLIVAWLGSRTPRIPLLIVVAILLPGCWQLAVTTTLYDLNVAYEVFRGGNRILDTFCFFTVGFVALSRARYRAWRVAAAEVAQLESRVLRTRATLLRLQLNPHFLFNALNSVAALLEDDTAAARKMAAELRQFVVRVLETSDREEVPLSEELDALAAYVAIENVRFGGRVTLDIQAGDDARRALVPGFLLQPLVENALRHGLLPRTGGRVSVVATISEGTLHITVDDNGRATDAELPAREGLGLSNTRARLAQAYGDDFVLDLRAGSGGFGVALGLPYRVAAPSVS
ncbi:MAG TPA: histidine kinase [Thermoanaerobaculia bacterium]